MQVSRITLSAPHHAAHGALAPALIVDLCWAAARPADSVEHVVALCAPGLVEVGVFVRADSREDAERRGRALVRRCREMSPLLRGWRVDSWVGALPPP